MSVASVASRERTELCDLMQELGPDAPTLDAGWSVIDLAAHLVAREIDLWAAPGIVWGGPFERAMAMAMERRRRQGLTPLLQKLAAGPPSIWGIVPAGAQLSEFYLHHEDVRRANEMAPRTGRPDLDLALARLVRASGPLLLRDIERGVDLVWNGGVLYRHGRAPRAVVSGPPGEILLYLSGRHSAAQVDFGGDPEALAVLRAADLSR